MRGVKLSLEQHFLSEQTPVYETANPLSINMVVIAW
jgi:hypothetical protein